MKQLSKLQTLVGLCTAVAFTLTLGLAAEAQVAITINGSAVDVSPGPLLQDGRVFVPLRGVFENLGASVVYDNGQINAQGGQNTISLHIGSTQADVNGQPQTIDVAPFIVGASTYVPLRFISQALGANVSWDENDHLVAITMNGMAQNAAPPQEQQYVSQADYDVNAPPPPIPDYQPPPCPDPNYLWQPGYWAWGPAGYYWVPGVWIAAPQPGYVWTPGYWAWQNGYYGFVSGYWGVNVGFYGGINYGGGYFGNGFVGGRWEGSTFRYNTAVLRVNTTVVRNVYVDRTVINNVTVNRVSYNGGPHGVTARPTSTQNSYASQHRLPMTSAQVEHMHYAAADRTLLSTVNHGAPPVTAATHPFTAVAHPAAPPVTAQDRSAAQHAVVHPAAVAPPQRPAYIAPHTAQPQHAIAPPAAAAAPHRPAYTAPHTMQPAVQQKPAYMAPRPAQAPAVQHPAVQPHPMQPHPAAVQPQQHAAPQKPVVKHTPIPHPTQ
ncbi:MAG: stalk domain-containing protein [Vulcanimicrobiaceae bacterium]